ncbi:MAG: Fic family protein [Gammaproteobacteria bacterium]|nr:Fic family protein [Gammaproteobacteria bacterium]
MEPLLIAESSPHRKKLTDLVMELASKSAAFKSSLPSPIRISLATLVRGMNCYYSNLIEGHDIHPIAIEQALQGHYSNDIKKRNLQLEAKAHILVQEWIDNGGIQGSLFSKATIRQIHTEFCSLLPEDLLWIENPTTKKKIQVVPGQLRQQDVIVANHIAISPGAVDRFLSYSENIYHRLGKAETVLALAAAHHRLLWIHPFLDGNGRVARLQSYAITLQLLDSCGLWSIARGLAQNVSEYKSHLANCDLRRRNDLDGRGNLSQEALIDFTYFFLRTCIDQINFMEKLMQPDNLRARILVWAKEEVSLGNLPSQSIQILDAILYRGEISRGEISGILNITDRHARRITSSLIDKGILTSATPRAALKLAFPATLASRLLPGLFPPE